MATDSQQATSAHGGARWLPAVVVLLAVGVLGLIGGWWWSLREAERLHEDLAFHEKRLALLDREIQRLQSVAENLKESDGAQTRERKLLAIQEAVVRQRGLPLLKPITFRTLPREALGGVILGEIERQYPGTRIEDIRDAWAALGLVPASLDLRGVYMGLLTEQIAAYFDQHAGELCTFEGTDLDLLQDRIILAHELTHALQDQHFHLAKLPLELRGNDDVVLAVQSLVEGDATLLMSLYAMDNLSPQGIGQLVQSMVVQRMASFASAPRYLRGLLTFPYLRGQEFCAELFADGGFRAIDRAYGDLPESSEQILHPEKYLMEPRDRPVKIAWPDAPLLGEEPVEDNVLGEFGVREMLAARLSTAVANKAAAGWGGDRYRTYRVSGGGVAAVLETVWDTTEDAQEFFDALTNAVRGSATAGEGTGPEGEGGDSAGEPPGVWRMGDRRVVWIRAPDARWREALWEFVKNAGEAGTRVEQGGS